MTLNCLFFDVLMCFIYAVGTYFQFAWEVERAELNENFVMVQALFLKLYGQVSTAL